MISKIKEQINVIDLIVDSVEENGGFSNLDKKAALNAIRNIYDCILIAPVINKFTSETCPEVEVSIYGNDEDENIEIEIEKFENKNINDDCEFIIENKLNDEVEAEEEDEDITVEELFFDSEGNVVESQMELNLSEEEAPAEEEEPEEEVDEIEEEESEEEIIEEVVETEENIVSQEDVKFFIGEINDDEPLGDLSLENEEIMAVLSEDKIVYANDNELLYEDNDIVFSDDEKETILNGMFDGNQSKYDDFIIHISKFSDFDEAILYLQENFATCNCQKSLELVAEKLTEKLI